MKSHWTVQLTKKSHEDIFTYIQSLVELLNRKESHRKSTRKVHQFATTTCVRQVLPFKNLVCGSHGAKKAVVNEPKTSSLHFADPLIV